MVCPKLREAPQRSELPIFLQISALHSNSSYSGSSKLRDMLTEVTSVLKTNMRCKLQFEMLDAILCNIWSPIAAGHYLE